VPYQDFFPQFCDIENLVDSSKMNSKISRIYTMEKLPKNPKFPFFCGKQKMTNLLFGGRGHWFMVYLDQMFNILFNLNVDSNHEIASY
jgi:hypothetical protein